MSNDDTTPADLTSIEAVVTRRQRLKAEIAQAEREINGLDDRIKAAWGDAPAATIGGQPAGTWQEVTSTRLDQGRVKDYLVEQGVLRDLQTTSTTRVFRLTWQPPEVEPTTQASGYDDVQGYGF